MSYAFALLVLWTILFFPLGIALHWLVLGQAARLQALPLSLLSGLSVAIVLLGAARQADIDVASALVQAGLLVGAIIILAAAWRSGVRLVDRPLVGGMLLLLIAVVLVQMPVFGGPNAGPLGQGTGHEPVMQVAEIRRVAEGGGPAGQLAQRAADAADQRYTGFEQLAGFTVAAGREVPGWSAGGMHGLIMGVLGMLVVLPLFVFARWRGVGRLGMLLALLVGALSPITYLAMGLAQAPIVAAVPFVTATMLALLIARRDRGWYALAAAYAAAVLVLVGPLGLLPVAAMAVFWFLTFRTTREHMTRTGASPVTADRPAAAAVLLAMFAVYGTASNLLSGVIALPADAMFDDVSGALLAWPFTWLGEGLEPQVPARLGEFAVWLVGPVLVVIAMAYAIARREMREVSVIAGVGVTILAGVVWSLVRPDDGIVLVQYGWLAGAPLLAVIVIRATGLSRSATDKSQSRFNAAGPLALLTVLALFSISATTVTGTRMTHAPSAPPGAGAEGERTISLADSPWLEYLYNAERPAGDVTDADEIARQSPHGDVESLVYGGYYRVVLSTDPFASDPPARYISSDISTLIDQDDTFAVRLFVDTRDDPAASATASGGSDPAAVQATTLAPTRHHPVEETPGDGPGGLLVPGPGLKGCTVEGAEQVCEPPQPARVGSCTDDMVSRARRPIEQGTLDSQSGQGAQESRPLLGVACWSVPLGNRTEVLMVHLRDVGIVLSPEHASLSQAGVKVPAAGSAAADDASRADIPTTQGAPARVGSDGLVNVEGRGTRIEYGRGRLPGPIDITVEGRFGAGASMVVNAGSGLDEVQEEMSLKAGPGQWSRIFPDVPRGGRIVITNTSGSRLQTGRVVARQTDMNAGCNVVVSASAGAFTSISDSTQPRMGLYVHDVVEQDGQRTAQVVLTTYQQTNGLPRQTLVDWVQQYDAEVPGSECFRMPEETSLPAEGDVSSFADAEEGSGGS